jgi:hypothetical protein
MVEPRSQDFNKIKEKEILLNTKHGLAVQFISAGGWAFLLPF